MKAIMISEAGGPEVLLLAEREAPVAKGTQVLIRVKAAGVNRPDVIQRQGKYPPPPNAPADIPGLEISGIIEACGPDCKTLKPNDTVCALITGGGYAEYAVAEESHCLPIPQGWDFPEAASIPETIFTVWHNVFQRGALKPGEHFLVHGGSSGIGITAIQLAKLFGARVFATAGSPEKCAACENLGAESCINYKVADFEQVLTNIKIDVVLDMIGGDYVAKNLRILKEEGRLVFINAMKGSKAEFDISEIMKRRLHITGSTLRPRDTAFKGNLAKEIRDKVWPLLESGAFAPVIYKVFPLHEASAAHQLMESSGHIGKIVLLV